MEDRERGLITVTILEFTCRVWGKQWKALGKIPGLWPKILTWDFSNTKEEYWPVKHDMWPLKHYVWPWFQLFNKHKRLVKSYQIHRCIT